MDRGNNFHRREEKFDRHVSEDKSTKEDMQASNSSHGKSFGFDGRQLKLGRHRHNDTPKRNNFKTMSTETHDQQRLVRNGISSTYSINDDFAENIHVKSLQKVQSVTDGLISNFGGGIPPPYVKPRKSKNNVDSEDDTLTFYLASKINRLDEPLRKPDFLEAYENVEGIERFT